MYTSTSEKFSNFIRQQIASKVREIREPKDNRWFYSRYNDDEQCVQSAIMVIEREYRNGDGYIVPMTDEDVLAEEIFLASDEHYLAQVCKQALIEAAECDEYIHDKIAWEVGSA